MVQKITNTLEFETQNSFCVEEVFVIDLKNFLLDDLLKFPSGFLLKCLTAGQVEYN